MKQQIVTFETPDAVVRLTNIKIVGNKFTLTLGTKEGKQRNFREQEVSGNVSGELRKYMTVLKPVKIPVKQEDQSIKWIKTGEMKTMFHKFCSKTNRHGGKTVLDQMIFECHNTSPEYQDNPFRLVMLDETNVLTLVNVPSKKRTSIVQPDGEVKHFYSVKKGTVEGRVVNAFITSENYRRLIVQGTEEVEVATEEEVQQAYS